ncbi:MAG: S8 family serine peptidase, partial [Candidatus Lokiarchaeota archaeon]|nr:S8 family serine peptidase [Candidatus Lokiarchaeota archaeon]
MNRKIYASLFLSLILLSGIYRIGEVSSIASMEDNVFFKDKIDPKIKDIIQDRGGMKNISNSETIMVIVSLSDNYAMDGFYEVEYLQILDIYSIINGFLAILQLNRVYILAKNTKIESIWLDHAENSIPSEEEKNNVLNFIESSNGDASEFVNFTKEIGAVDLWARGINGSGVVIAVMDSGVDLTGQIGGDLDDFDDDLGTTDPKFVGAVSMVPEEPLYYTDFTGRGTFHAGIACGTGHLSNSSNPNNKTYAGVAPGASFLNVKIYDSIGLTYWSFMISGIEWAIQHSADILLFCTSILGAYVDPISIAITNAVRKGLVVVTPTGDDGPSYMSVTTPGQALGSISVGAYNSHLGGVANFSSRGFGLDFRTVPDIMAPGVDLIGPRSRIFTNDSLSLVNGLGDQLSEYSGLIGELVGGEFDDLENMIPLEDLSLPDNLFPRPAYGTPINENYTKSSGTGAATAVVAGCLALLIEAFPLANPQLLTTAICNTAYPISEDLNAEGSGLINVSAAYDYLHAIFGEENYERLAFSVPLPYAGIISTSNSSQWNETALGQSLDMNSINAYDMNTIFSTQALMDAVVLTNGTSEETLDFVQIHTPLNQFGLRYEDRVHWFSEFRVVKEFHQMTTINLGDEDYNRYIGILGLNGLYVVVIVETWNYIADYINIADNEIFYEYLDRVNGFRYEFRFLNLREDEKPIEDLQLISYFKADMFLNETGALDTNNTECLMSILNVGLDDNITYDDNTQTMCVADYNNNTNYSHPYKYAIMGINSTSDQVSGYRIDDSIDLLGNLTSAGLLNQPALPEDYFNNGSYYTKGTDDPGFAMLYDINESLGYGIWDNHSGIFSMGLGTTLNNANDTLYELMGYIDKNVTQYEIKDIVVASADFNRMHYENEVYISECLLFNVGNVAVNNCQIAFTANRYTENGEIETFSILKPVDVFEVSDYYKLVAEWTPQEEGVYLIGWIVIDISSNYLEVYTEDNILNNILSRSVYVVNRNFYQNILRETFRAYPHKLDQEPWTIHFPGDIALFNISTYNLLDIPNVTVTLDGQGSNYMTMMWNGPDIFSLLGDSLTGGGGEDGGQSGDGGGTEDMMSLLEFNTTLYKEKLQPYDMLFVVGFGPLLCPQG